MSSAFGVFPGFCLGLPCMAWLSLTEGSEAPAAPPLSKPDQQKDPPHSVVSPPKTPLGSSPTH